jgi:hypothetical protein
MKWKPLTLLFILTLSAAPSLNGQSVVLHEVDLVNNIIEITNDGGSDIDLSDWWLCNRVNGSPFYQRLTDGASINGLSTEASGGSADLLLETGDILVLDVGAGFLPDDVGEFSLYNTNSFGSASAIEEYIAWGGNGIRDSVAATAGIWDNGLSVDVSGLADGLSVQLTPGTAGNSVVDYSVGASSIGTIAAIPEPASAAFLLSGLAVVLLKRRRM